MNKEPKLSTINEYISSIDRSQRYGANRDIKSLLPIVLILQPHA